MAYTTDEIKQIILTNPNRTMLDAARVMSKKLRMHIEGDGLDECIEAMPYFERPELLTIRKKYARSNQDVFERLFRQRDKVFTAKGGSKMYMLPEAQEKKFRAYLSVVKDGMSLEKWIEQIALKAFDVDPMSLTFIELNENGQAYPTYKSTSAIYGFIFDPLHSGQPEPDTKPVPLQWPHSVANSHAFKNMWYFLEIPLALPSCR